jgi:hypothetical protein
LYTPIKEWHISIKYQKYNKFENTKFFFIIFHPSTKRNVSCTTVVHEIRDMRWVPRRTHIIGPTMCDLFMSLDFCTTVAQLLCKNHVPSRQKLKDATRSRTQNNYITKKNAKSTTLNTTFHVLLLCYALPFQSLSFSFSKVEF